MNTKLISFNIVNTLEKDVSDLLFDADLSSAGADVLASTGVPFLRRSLEAEEARLAVSSYFKIEINLNMVIAELEEFKIAGRIENGKIVIPLGEIKTDQQLKLLASLDSKKRALIVDIDLSNSSVTDDGLSYLLGFNNLEKLDLTRTNIGNRGIETISAIRKLRYLNLTETKIDDRAAPFIKKLPVLEKLILYRTNIGDKSAAEVAQISTLIYLSFSATMITRAGILSLQPLPRLKTLLLVNCSLYDNDLRSILVLGPLEELFVDSNPLTDNFLETVAMKARLKFLSIKGGLEVIELGIRELKRKRPDLIIQS